MENNLITDTADCQKELFDISATGKDRKWRERKMANELLACAYDDVNPKKAIRLRQCSTVLTFREFEDGTKKLDSMNSCRVRLCPICSWRRSLKCYANTLAIMRELDKGGQYNYIFLTLTLRNVRGSELSLTLNRLFEGFNRYMQLKPLKVVAKGWYRGVEVTHDTDEYLSAERVKSNPKYYAARGLRAGDRNPNFNTYHPHVHCILVVNKSYWTSRYYLKKERFAELWQQSLRLDYLPICDVRKVKGNTQKAIAEISKYAAKASDYICPDDWDLTVDSVRTLDAALDRRRLVAYGGVMRDTFRRLKLEDAEKGDLVHVDGEQTQEQAWRLVSYFWHSGYRQYLSRGDA